jgi:hypothetical protein
MSLIGCTATFNLRVPITPAAQVNDNNGYTHNAIVRVSDKGPKLPVCPRPHTKQRQQSMFQHTHTTATIHPSTTASPPHSHPAIPAHSPSPVPSSSTHHISAAERCDSPTPYVSPPCARRFGEIFCAIFAAINAATCDCSYDDRPASAPPPPPPPPPPPLPAPPPSATVAPSPPSTDKTPPAPCPRRPPSRDEWREECDPRADRVRGAGGGGGHASAGYVRSDCHVDVSSRSHGVSWLNVPTRDPSTVHRLMRQSWGWEGGM